MPFESLAFRNNINTTQILDRKRVLLNKKSFQEYTNKQKLDRIFKRQNQVDDFLRQSLGSAGNMNKKILNVKDSTDSIRMNGMERSNTIKITLIVFLYFDVIR